MNPTASDTAHLSMGRVRLGGALGFLGYFFIQAGVAAALASRQEIGTTILVVAIWLILFWRTISGGRIALGLIRFLAVLFSVLQVLVILIALGSALVGKLPADKLFVWHELILVLVKVAGLTYIIWALFLARDVQDYLAHARRQADLRKLARTTTP